MSLDVVGTWVLESFEIENPQKEKRQWGANSQGLLIYTDNGYMSVSINKTVEAKSNLEAQNLFDSILFYSGTYLVDGSTVRHKVTQASNPSRIGKEMLRFAELSEGILTLSSPEESFGRAILKWRKV